MALYQPSNITPSTFAGIGGGVVDVSDKVSISWQVNGNSAMTGFTIKIYTGGYSSSLVHTFTETLGTPFYGTDALGNPVFYVYEPNTTWASAGLTNGGSYKLKITMNWSENGSTKSVVQNSDSVFITRAAPTLSISPASGTLSTVAQTFTGSYSQAQGDAVSWVRWVLSDGSGNVIEDTGTIYTGVLSYFHSGFFSGQTYTVSCTVETASGAEVTAVNTYAVSYDSEAQTGGIAVSCNPDDSVTLSWAAGADIPGVPSAEDYGLIIDGVLHLAASRSITWSAVNDESMSFPSPYCFAWRGTIAETTTETETVGSGSLTLWKQIDQQQTVNDTVTISSLSLTKPYTGSRSQSISTTVGSSLTGTEYEYETVSTDEATYDSGEGMYVFTILVLSSKYLVNAEVTQLHGWTQDAVISGITSQGFSITLKGLTPQLSADIRETIRYYMGSSTYTATESGVRDPVVVSTTAESAETGMNGASNITVTVKAYSTGTYSTTVSYTYSYTSSDSYSGSVTKTFSSSTGTLLSASVISTTGTSASVTTSGQNYTVKVYYGSNTSRTVTVSLRFSFKITVSDSYRSYVSGTKEGAVAMAVASHDATRVEIQSFNASTGAYTIVFYYSENNPRTATLAFTIPIDSHGTDLVTVSDGTHSAVISVEESGGNTDATLTIDGSAAAAVYVPASAWNMLAVVKPGVFQVYFFDSSGTYLSSGSDTFPDDLPSPVSSITAEGEQECDFIYLTKNTGYDFSAMGYEPGWDRNTLFYASFAADLQGGTVSDDSSLSVAIYRQEGTSLEPVGIFGGTIHTVTDYAIRSGHEYLWRMFYIASGIYSAGAASSSICRQFRQHTLIEAEEDALNPGVYHPVNVWRFSDNLDAGSYTNQNSPVMLENFTAYPLWQPSSPRAKSGTLTALLGRFVKPDGYTGDTVEAMEKLFALSASVNPLFYRDMKGNLYMVRLAGPITQTIDNKTGMLEVSVSVPWVEVGDADNVKIYTEG